MKRADARAPSVEVMTIGPGVAVTGQVHSTEDLIVEGHINGSVWCEDGELRVAAGGEVIGDIVGRDVTVLGTVDGQVIATEVLDIRSGADVTGRLVVSRVIVEEGAVVHGRVEPQHIDTAVRVARFQQERQRSVS